MDSQDYLEDIMDFLKNEEFLLDFTLEKSNKIYTINFIKYIISENRLALTMREIIKKYINTDNYCSAQEIVEAVDILKMLNNDNCIILHSNFMEKCEKIISIDEEVTYSAIIDILLYVKSNNYPNWTQGKLDRVKYHNEKIVVFPFRTRTVTIPEKQYITWKLTNG